MTLQHRIKSVHYRPGAEGTEVGINRVRVANQIGLLDLPIAEVQRRAALGDTFETWHTRATVDPITEPVQVIIEPDGHAHLHVKNPAASAGLTHLPTF